MVSNLNNAMQQKVNSMRRELTLDTEAFSKSMKDASDVLRKNVAAYTTRSNSVLMDLTALYDSLEEPEAAIAYDTTQSRLVTRLAAIEDKMIELFAHAKEAADIINECLNKGKPE